MLTYAVKYSRYDKRSGEMRLSNVQWITADTFSDAHTQAVLTLLGLKGADPVRDYDIAIIDHSRELHRAVDCTGGIHMFETAEELSTRLEARRKD